MIIQAGEDLDGPLQPGPGIREVGVHQGGAAGLVEQARPRRLVLGELGRVIEGSLRFLAEGERERPPAGLGQRLAGRRADPGGVGGLGIGGRGVEKMGGEDLGHLRRGVAPALLQVTGGGQMACLAVAAPQRAIGSAAHQALQEVVLASLRRQRIIVECEQLLGHHAVEGCFDLLGGARSQSCHPGPCKRVPEHGGVLEHRALGGAQPVQPRRHERVQRLGHVELGDVGGEHIPRTLLREQATVEQHAHRLDRVQGHALSAAEDPPGQLLGQAGNQTIQGLAHGAVAQCSEHDRMLRPRRTGVQQLAPSAGQNEQRAVRRPFQQVVDELQQPGVGPLQVLED